MNTFLKQLEPRLQLAQTRFPTNQYGAQNQTLVNEIEGVVDLWSVTYFTSKFQYSSYHN
jgi:hypothetical protein